MKIKNKNNLMLILAISIIIIAISSFIIFMIVIWSEDKNSEIGKYTVTSENYKDKISNMYKTQLEILLKEKNRELLYKRLDESYLNENGFNKEKDKNSIFDYLVSNKFISDNVYLTDYVLAEGNDSGVEIYRFGYISNGQKKYVNIIEEEPYVYTISFEQNGIPNLLAKSVSLVRENIKFDIILGASDVNSVRYDAQITSYNNNEVIFDFNDSSKTSLNLSDGSVINRGAVVAYSEDWYRLLKNSYINQRLFFNVSMEKQSLIKSITFHNVKIGNEIKNITIDF